MRRIDTIHQLTFVASVMIFQPPFNQFNTLVLGSKSLTMTYVACTTLLYPSHNI